MENQLGRGGSVKVTGSSKWVCREREKGHLAPRRGDCAGHPSRSLQHILHAIPKLERIISKQQTPRTYDKWAGVHVAQQLAPSLVARQHTRGKTKTTRVFGPASVSVLHTLAVNIKGTLVGYRNMHGTYRSLLIFQFAEPRCFSRSCALCKANQQPGSHGRQREKHTDREEDVWMWSEVKQTFPFLFLLS